MTITGIRLPTCLQVLRCTMHHCSEAAHSKHPGSVGAPGRCTTAKLVLEQITTFYQNGNIPMVSEQRACEKIVSCWMTLTSCALLKRVAATHQPHSVNWKTCRKCWHRLSSCDH